MRRAVTIWTDAPPDTPTAPRPGPVVSFETEYAVDPGDRRVDPAEHARWNLWFCIVLAAAIGAVACAAVHGG
jgi:hypothetical protein